MKAMLSTIFSAPVVIGVALVYAMNVMFAIKGAHLLLIALALALIWHLVSQLLARAKLSRRTLAAYQAENPSCFIGMALTCNECNSERITGMPHHGQSDYRQYSCKDCGNVLYFTKK
jgi:hypothetical protein